MTHRTLGLLKELTDINMIKKTIEIRFEELDFSELSQEQMELVNSARKATDNSNARYSQFNVGAAIRLADGQIVIGANQENAAFPLCLCAERTAIFAAQANYPDQAITQIAICARTKDGFTESPVSPCGSCRQVMTEMEDRYGNAMSVLLCGKNKVYRMKTARDILPLGFVDADMR